VREADGAAADLDASKAADARAERDGSYTAAQLMRGLEAFSPLGLQFEPSDDGRLRMQISRCDPSDPERALTFWVAVDASETYTAGGADPPMPALADFLAELNSSGDFSRFVQKTRAEFKSMVGGGGGGGGRGAKARASAEGTSGGT